MQNSTYIIAEIAQGYEGNPWLCKKFIELAKASDADAVKFQIFDTGELCTNSYTYYELFKSLEIDKDIWISLINYAESLGIDFISDIFGIETLEWIKDTSIKGFKIHSTDVRNFDLLEKLKATGKHVYLSTGGSELIDIQTALEVLGTGNVTLLTGFQAEPNELSDIELDKITFLKNLFKVRIGYADHIDPKYEMAVVVPAMAVQKGAEVIEKHLTIERDYLKIEDYISALNPAEFKRMVELIRNTEQFSQTGNTYNLGERETLYRYKMKKNVLAATDLPEGHVITGADLVLLRTGFEINKSAYFDKNELIGKTLKESVKKHTAISKTTIK